MRAKINRNWEGENEQFQKELREEKRGREGEKQKKPARKSKRERSGQGKKTKNEERVVHVHGVRIT